MGFFRSLVAAIAVLISPLLPPPPIVPIEVPIIEPDIFYTPPEQATTTVATTTSATTSIKRKCSCVDFVRSVSKFQPPRVEKALDIPAIVFEPRVGYWVLFDYAPDGHAGLVSWVGTSTIEVLDFNKKPCEYGKYFISKKDVHIRGYFGYEL